LLRLAHGRGERRAASELRALHVADAGGGRRELEPRQRAEAFRGGQAEISRKPALGRRPVEHVARERGHRRQRAQIGGERAVAVERVRHDDLAWLEPGDVGGKAGAVAFGDAELAGGNIDPGERETALFAHGGARAGDREQVVVALCVEQRVFGERAGRDQADDVAPHHALAAALLRLGRVLELFAHRDAMAEGDQAVEIFVGAMDRHAAHGDVAAQVLAALGEHDAEGARRDLGVLEEQLIEIAHPIEQQAIRIGGLDLDILLHHRRGARSALGARAGFEAGGNDRARSIHGPRR
jgi:hypothetical protein